MTEERFGLKPERLAADTAYGSAANLNWLVNDKKIAPHIRHVTLFADTATAEDVRRFQVHLTESGVQPPTLNSSASALRFFFGTTLDRAETPPEKANQRDDGYLSASEVAALKLDADFVILSACNTAGAAGPGSAEALSGLARAFFYAGARAILVSHWAVYSDSTVKLITGALRAMVTDKRIGRAEALRRSMLALINKGEAKEAHPAYWAPFVVVGEGGAAR